MKKSICGGRASVPARYFVDGNGSGQGRPLPRICDFSQVRMPAPQTFLSLAGALAFRVLRRKRKIYQFFDGRIAFQVGL